MKSRKKNTRGLTAEDIIKQALRDPKVARGLDFMDGKDDYYKAILGRMQELSEGWAGVVHRDNLYHSEGCEIRGGRWNARCTCGLDNNVSKGASSINNLYALLEHIFRE